MNSPVVNAVWSDFQGVDYGDMVSNPSYSQYSAPWMPSSTTDYVPKSAQRKAKRLIPDTEKDNKYWEKRKRNNMAAKKSRESKRLMDAEVRQKVNLLEEDNALLKREISILKSKLGIPLNHCVLTEEERSECMKEVKAMQAVDPDTTCTSNVQAARLLAQMASGGSSMANASSRNLSPVNTKTETTEGSEAKRQERNIPSVELPTMSAITPPIGWTCTSSNLYQYPHIPNDYYHNDGPIFEGRDNSFSYSNRLTHISQQHDYQLNYHNQQILNRKLLTSNGLTKSGIHNESDDEEGKLSVDHVSSTCAHMPGDLLTPYPKRRRSTQELEDFHHLQHRNHSPIANCDPNANSIHSALHSMDDRRKTSIVDGSMEEDGDIDLKLKVDQLSAEVQKCKQFVIAK